MAAEAKTPGAVVPPCCIGCFLSAGLATFDSRVFHWRTYSWASHVIPDPLPLFLWHIAKPTRYNLSGNTCRDLFRGSTHHSQCHWNSEKSETVWNKGFSLESSFSPTASHKKKDWVFRAGFISWLWALPRSKHWSPSHEQDAGWQKWAGQPRPRSQGGCSTRQTQVSASGRAEQLSRLLCPYESPPAIMGDGSHEDTHI